MSAIFKHTIEAIDRICSPKDNPARVAPPERHYATVGQRRMEGMDDLEQRRCIVHWLSFRPNSDDIVSTDILGQLNIGRLLQSFAAGDDHANGDAIKDELMKLRKVIQEDHHYWRHDR